MIYTNSVRVAVLRRIIREQLGVDDVAFEALCDQETAKREAEDKVAQKRAQDDAKRQAIEDAAKGFIEEAEPEVETKEFGGDFGEERALEGEGVAEKAKDRADSGDEPGRVGAKESEGAVESVGPTT